MKIEISIIVPVYNEESCLEKNLDAILTHLEGFALGYELVLINDGSTDGSHRICQDMVRKHMAIQYKQLPTNHGKGYAVKTGMGLARGRYRIMMDADLAVPLEFIGPCYDLLQRGHAVVIGSRHLPEAVISIPESPIRQFCGEVYRRLARPVLGLRVSDITCGLKGFSAKAAETIFPQSTINRWSYDAEIIFIAQQSGYSIMEMPVEWLHSFDSKVHVLRDAITTFWEMARIYYRFRCGSYPGGRK